MTRIRRPAALALLALAASLALAGCGKKPGLVDYPRPEGQVDPYPRKYPLPSTDPKPGQPDSGFTFP
ncbi:hypothetical protein [Azospirillum thermophilum]|uniref:Lipoprotein n=1 Tax=Azospirillum thermophilum TaxID=2202148 RepID=A0A2S2CWV5_9PROT|nr:hypothetical protein [Azospirillum thermophilum]AWK88966.1 hypothetical protein DEW08_23320 [Azospirillum thermophilum]